MKTTGDSRLVDTCVLLDATNSLRPRHWASTALLETDPRLVMSAQVAREYLVVATRPTFSNGLGMETTLALENLARIRRLVRLLPEERPVLPAFLAMVRATPCSGKTLHDAFLVATMKVHGVRTLVTCNPSDFARFGDAIAVVQP